MIVHGWMIILQQRYLILTEILVLFQALNKCKKDLLIKSNFGLRIFIYLLWMLEINDRE